MTRLQNTPYDRLTPPASIAETRERARTRAERLALAAQRAEFEGRNVETLVLRVAEHVVTRLGRQARERNAEPAAFAAALVADGLDALEAGALDAPSDADAAADRAEITRLKGKIVGLERAAEIYRSGRDEARAQIKAMEKRRGAKAEAPDIAMRRADAAALQAAATLAAQERAHAEALAGRDLELATARSAIDDLREMVARLEARVAAPLDNAGAAKEEAASATAEPSVAEEASAAPRPAKPKGKPYRWPPGYGR